MKLSLSAAILALPALLLATLSQPAAAQIKIGVIVSATGAMAAVGIAQEKGASLLPRRVGDFTIDYIVRDDASDPAQTVTLARQLIGTHKVDAIIGPTGTPNALALIPLLAEAGVPLLAPVGSAAVVLPMEEQKRWVFKLTPNDSVMAEVLAAHMHKRGFRNVGLMAYDDAYGERWINEFSGPAQQAGLRVTMVERFRADVPVDAATARLLAGRPDAVLVAGSGPSSLAVHLALVDRGYKGAIYHTHGATDMDFIRRGDKKVVGALLAASPLLAINELADGNPSKALGRAYITAYERRHGGRAAAFSANVYDAGLLLHKTLGQILPRARPGTPEFRAALRDALEQTRDFPVTQGVITMSAADHAGLDKRSRLMMVIFDHTWKLVTD